MSNQGVDLELLSKKYLEQVNDLQEKLDEVKKRYTIVSEALELLRKDGDVDQKKLFQPVISEKFKVMSMPDAIKNIIESNPNRKASAGEIHSELIKHGFQSNSTNIKRDVFIRLYRLRKSGKLLFRSEKGIRKYYLVKTKERN